MLSLYPITTHIRSCFTAVSIILIFHGLSVAQGTPSYARYFASREFILDEFIKILSGTPTSPTALEDFAPYLPSPYDFELLYAKYDTVIKYVNNYKATHSEEEFWEHMGLSSEEPHDPIDQLPPCFADLYYGHQLLIVSVALCCAATSGAGCVGCVAAGAVGEQILVNQFYTCIANTYGGG